MCKYSFINRLMHMYYDGLTYFRLNFDDKFGYYESLNSSSITKMLYDSISQFLLYDYAEDKLQLILDIVEIDFENAKMHNNFDLFANVLYTIATEDLSYRLESARIEVK